MANLLGQNIGTNYKGILNLNTLNGNLTTTLEAITDGDGNASTLLLSTTLARVSSNLTIGGSTTASARLHVRGDGTNPIARFEDNAGNAAMSVENSRAVTIFTTITTPAIAVRGTEITVGGGGGGGNTGSQFNISGLGAATFTSGTGGAFGISQSITMGAGSGNWRAANIAYTINNSGAQTGTATGIFLNATETALNGMGHNLMDLQRDGVSQFRISRIGDTQTRNRFVFIPNSDYLEGSHNTGFTTLSSAQNIQLIAGSSFIFRFLSTGIINLGGGTNSFPAIKRNGAAIEARLADDSNYTDINALNFNLENNGYIGSRTNSGFRISFLGTGFINYVAPNGHSLNSPTIIGATGGSLNASAILQVDSTTRGFLPPRLTTAQRDLIATPAAGLMIYNTSTNRPNFYDGSAWVAL